MKNTSNNIASMVGNNNVLSSGALSKGDKTQNGLFSMVSGDNPSYTIKDGGTLKKKLQPYAADQVQRDGLGIDRERLLQVTAPGDYTLP